MKLEAPAKLEALVLAAGAGSRFGGGKLLAPWRDGVLLDGALAAAFAAPARTVTLATGADFLAVEAAARAFAAKVGESERLRVIHVPRYVMGMGVTLRTAAESVAGDANGLFVFLGDMPRVPHGVLPRLAEALGAASAAAPVFGGKRGHPVLFGAGLLPALSTLEGDAGAQGILRELGGRLALVETDDPGVLFDVDTPDDLARASLQ